MKERILDKIGETERLLDELAQIKPEELEDYLDDLMLKAACERYFEKIIEAVVNLSFLLVRYLKLEIPDDEKSVFLILVKEKIIDSDLAEKMIKAKGMRNIIAHEYGIIDDSKVFEAVSILIIPYVEEFLKQIKKAILK